MCLKVISGADSEVRVKFCREESAVQLSELLTVKCIWTEGQWESALVGKLA